MIYAGHSLSCRKLTPGHFTGAIDVELRMAGLLSFPGRPQILHAGLA